LLDDRIGDVREKVLAMGTDACIVVTRRKSSRAG